MSDRLAEIEQHYGQCNANCYRGLPLHPHPHLLLSEEDLYWLIEEIRRLRFWITEARALYANVDANSAPLLDDWMDRGESPAPDS